MRFISKSVLYFLSFLIPLLFIKNCIEDNSNYEKNKKALEQKNLKQKENERLLSLPTEERQKIVIERLILDKFKNNLDSSNKL